jgi:hypothetical protein
MKMSNMKLLIFHLSILPFPLYKHDKQLVAYDSLFLG